MKLLKTPLSILLILCFGFLGGCDNEPKIWAKTGLKIYDIGYKVGKYNLDYEKNKKDIEDILYRSTK